MVEVFHKRQILMGSSKKISLGAAVIPINDLSSTTRDQWYSLYPAKNVQGRNTHSKGGDLLPVSGEIHIVMNIVNEKAANEPPPPTVPKEGPEPEVPKIVATEQEDEPAKSRDQEPQKKRVSEDTKTKLKNLLNTSTYAQRLMNSKRLEIQTSGLITSYFTITYTQDSFSKHLESELEKLPEVDLLSVPFPAMITEMYPYVDHNILSPTIWAVTQQHIVYLHFISFFFLLQFYSFVHRTVFT